MGTGGYASGPTLRMAHKLGIPTLIQEQNSFAGLTNKWLSKKALKICVAYDNMERFFESNKIILTGKGRVGKGALEIIDFLGIEEVNKEDFLFKKYKKIKLIINKKKKI